MSDYYNNDDDLEKAIQDFIRVLMELESKGYIKRVGNKLDEFGIPYYELTKKGINKVFDNQLKFTGRKN